MRDPLGLVRAPVRGFAFPSLVLPLLVQLRVSYADDVSFVVVVGSQIGSTEVQLLVGGGRHYVERIFVSKGSSE